MNPSSWTLLKKCAALGTGIATVAAATLYGNNVYSSSPPRDQELVPISELRPGTLASTATARVPVSVSPARLSVPDSGKRCSFNDKLNTSIAKARYLCETVKDEFGLPGLVISVSVNGKCVWEEGFGYADLENRVPMSPDSVLRIASISKAMTVAMLGKLIEDGKIDIDLPIQAYVQNFPEKSVDGKKVIITTRHLLSHLSGIRHYWKKGENEDDEGESGNKEFLFKQNFKTVDEALKLFQDDELHHAPGFKYHYTTHGFTLVSRIMEAITNVPFDKYATKMFNTWGLKNTFLDVHETVIYNRARCYTRSKKRRIINSPYVDNSYKWAGGGFLSTVRDLTQFSHMLMYSYQNGDKCGQVTGDKGHNKPDNNKTTALTLTATPFLKKSTIANLWNGDLRTLKEDSEFLYGLGFQVEQPFRKCAFCKGSELLTVGHSGGAVGASSILFIRMPSEKQSQLGHDEVDPNRAIMTTSPTPNPSVQGLVIVMITNLTDVALSKTAYEISNLFSWLM